MISPTLLSLLSNGSERDGAPGEQGLCISTLVAQQRTKARPTRRAPLAAIGARQVNAGGGSTAGSALSKARRAPH